MIETGHQRHAAKSRMQPWSHSRSAGQQSWQGYEEALETEMHLLKQIEEYDQREVVQLEVAPP